MLSSFAYTRFAQTVGARAHDSGIEVVEVKAAYSSIIGKLKYARRYGLSVHRAAAFVLARRAQKFPDRLKPSSRKRFATTCKDRREPVFCSPKSARGNASILANAKIEFCNPGIGRRRRFHPAMILLDDILANCHRRMSFLVRPKSATASGAFSDGVVAKRKDIAATLREGSAA